MAFVLFGALLFSLSPARADDLFPEDWPYNIFGSISLTIGGVGGLSTSLFAFIDIGQNQRPSQSTLAICGIFGVLNTVAGIGYLASSDSDFVMGVGITHIVFGVVGLGATIWGSQIPKDDDLAVSPAVFAPVPGSDSAAFGVVVSGRF